MLDELTRAGVKARLVAVFFTHGDRRTVTQDGHQVALGKAWLVSRLHALLQGSRLHLPGTAEAAALGREPPRRPSSCPIGYLSPFHQSRARSASSASYRATAASSWAWSSASGSSSARAQ